MSKTAGILMPCRGHLPHVQLAVQSILSQTHRDFDFLIINDGSEPVVREYLENIQDSRVRVIHHETSIGVSRSLNKGLRELQTEIVIRMDSDDIAHPGRLALQCQYLTAHPEITVLGGQVQNMDGQGKSPRVPLTHPDIGYRLNWSNALNHPTVAYRRKEILDFGGYDESLGPLEEDLELWTRLFFQTRLANLAEVILDYRVHPNQTSKVHWAATETVRSRIRQTFRQKLTGCTVAPVFDYQDRWTPEYRPSQEEWEGWTGYLNRLREVMRGFPGSSGDPGRDLARRFYHSAARFKSAGGDPGDVRSKTKKLSRWYALTKGIL